MLLLIYFHDFPAGLKKMFVVGCQLHLNMLECWNKVTFSDRQTVSLLNAARTMLSVPISKIITSPAPHTTKHLSPGPTNLFFFYFSETCPVVSQIPQCRSNSQVYYVYNPPKWRRYLGGVGVGLVGGALLPPPSSKMPLCFLVKCPPPPFLRPS